MSGDFDHESEACAAMRKAVCATETDRLQWLRVAVAWQDLGRSAEQALVALETAAVSPQWKRYLPDR
jgi:hypothetical protein